MSLFEGRRAFLWTNDRRCYVVLVVDGVVLDTVRDSRGTWRLSGSKLGLFSAASWLNAEAHYDDVFFAAWWVSKNRTAELLEVLDGHGLMTGTDRWIHNDPMKPTPSPGPLDAALRLLGAVSEGKRERLAKAIVTAVHPDGDTKDRSADADELAYLSGELLGFVRDNAEHWEFWGLLARHGWPATTPTASVTGNSRDSAAASPPPPPSDDAAGRWVRECQQCGRKFNSVRNDARYHSDACRQAAHRAGRR